MIFESRRAALACLPLLAIGVIHLVGCRPPVTAPEKTPPAAANGQAVAEKPRTEIFVETSYPGADAQTVADTISAPVEQQINGVENMVYMRSQSRSDGSYLLAVEFKEGTDPAVAQKLVQDRVGLATPVLPEIIKRRGMTIKQASPGPVLVCCLSSPTGSRDERFLSNYASTKIRDELVRLPGVAEVATIPEFHSGLRVALDSEKMAALIMSIADVQGAIREQNLQAPGAPAANPGLPGAPMLQLKDAPLDKAQIENIVVKTSRDGRVIRLRDVAKIEQGTEASGAVSHQGTPAVAIFVWPLGQAHADEVRRAVQNALTELKPRMPSDVALDKSFDFLTLPEPLNPSNTFQYILLDVALPSHASLARQKEALDRCGAILNGIEGMQDWLALSGNPFDRFSDQPCILVRLALAEGQPDRPQYFKREIRKRIGEEIKELEVTIRDITPAESSTSVRYGIDLGINGPEPDKVNDFATRLVERLRKKNIAIDLGDTIMMPPEERIHLEIDRDKLSNLGISLADVRNTLQVYLGAPEVGNPKESGKNWVVDIKPLELSLDHDSRARIEGLERLTVRDTQGKMVPLSACTTIRQSLSPAVVNRLDLQTFVEITANPADGITLADFRKDCESLATEIRAELSLPATYQLIWLRPLSVAK